MWHDGPDMEPPELQVGCMGALAKVGLRLGYDVGCCDECHDEVAYGYGELVEFTFGDGVVARVCCTIRGKLEEIADG